ncbi:hypothetical protein DAMA08_006050 [Martiniozyma asiatica (nom. inval.)]|nr:hypothetical protein DAMA08_006050 [Martiniozyma asiatica]
MVVHLWREPANSIARFDIDGKVLSVIIGSDNLLADSNYLGDVSSLTCTSPATSMPIPYMDDVQTLGEVYLQLLPKLPLVGKDAVVYRSLLKSTIDNLVAITVYLLYQGENWTGFTRPELGKLIPWPFQYHAAIMLKDIADEICFSRGLSHGNDSTFDEQMQELRNKEKELHETPVLADIQKREIDKQLEIVNQKKQLLANMRCIELFKLVLARAEKLDQGNTIHKIITTYIQAWFDLEKLLPSKFLFIWLKEQGYKHEKMEWPKVAAVHNLSRWDYLHGIVQNAYVRTPL